MRRSFVGYSKMFQGAEEHRCCSHNAYGAWDSHTFVQDLRPKIVVRPDNAVNLLT
jgi:hypothetical protein